MVLNTSLKSSFEIRYELFVLKYIQDNYDLNIFQFNSLYDIFMII